MTYQDTSNLPEHLATLVARAWTWKALQKAHNEAPMHPYEIVDELVEAVISQYNRVAELKRTFDRYDARGFPRDNMLAFEVVADVRELFYPTCICSKHPDHRRCSDTCACSDLHECGWNCESPTCTRGSHRGS